ncbi:MAG: AI-2E family transporter, partial [Pygmaiobacter sp.]
MNLDKKTVKTILGILCGTILFAWCLVNNKIFFGLLGSLISLLSPFLMGLAIAFVLNVPMRAIQHWFFSSPRFEKKRGFARGISLVFAILAVLLVFALVTFIVVPEIATTVKLIGEGFPSFLVRLRVWGEELSVSLPALKDEIAAFTGGDEWKNLGLGIQNFIGSGAAGNLLGSTVTLASSVVGGVVNFFIGVIFAAYILTQKEKLGAQMKRLFYAWLSEHYADRVLYVAALCNRVFTRFITGQCLEAVILGSMFFVSMTVLRFPYATLVAVLITVTALIPIFGAFIGCFVGAFLMLV